MKTMKLKFRNLALIAVVGFAAFAVSCNKEDDFIPQEVISSESGELKSAAPKKGELSIAEVAITNGNFTQLVAALSYVDAELETGLVDLFLNGTDQYTVFAPTDAAFTALYSTLTEAGIGEIDEITDLPASLVLNVLLYHVTEGRRAANSVVPKNGVRTIETLLEGATFSVNTMAEIQAVGNMAQIVMPNISANNGIIHVIDTVILPISLD